MPRNGLTTGYEIAVPALCVGPDDRGARYAPRGEIRGTAFPIGGPFFLTADHVARALTDDSEFVPVLGLIDETERFTAVAIEETESLGNDVALLRVAPEYEPTLRFVHPFPWVNYALNGLDDVMSLGFAYGVYRAPDRPYFIQRAFKGHVVAPLPSFAAPGVHPSGFEVYELSFAAPRGLSGAPLFTPPRGPLEVAGIVIGNSQSRMLVHSSREQLADGSRETIVEHYESLSLGIAVTAQELFPLESALLKGTLESHLATHGLSTR